MGLIFPAAQFQIHSLLAPKMRFIIRLLLPLLSGFTVLSSPLLSDPNLPSPPPAPNPVLQWHADQQRDCFHTRFTYSAEYPGTFHASPNPISDTMKGTYEAWSFPDAADRVCEGIGACHSIKWRMLCHAKIVEIGFGYNLDNGGKAKLFDSWLDHFYQWQQAHPLPNEQRKAKTSGLFPLIKPS